MLGKLKEQVTEARKDAGSVVDRLTIAVLFTGLMILILALAVLSSAH